MNFWGTFMRDEHVTIGQYDIRMEGIGARYAVSSYGGRALLSFVHL